MALSNIRFFRMQKGLKLYELAARIGVSESKLSLIETGRREMNSTIRSALAEALGVSVNTLDETAVRVSRKKKLTPPSGGEDTQRIPPHMQQSTNRREGGQPC